jgi:nucleoid-associated protein YgaU
MSAPLAFAAASAGPAVAGAGAPPKVEHAFLELRDPPMNKRSLQPGPPRGRITFQFNPKDLTLSKSAKWGRDAQKGAKKSAVPHFGGAEPSKLTLEMFLDASDTQDDSVVKTVEQLFACCVPTDETHQSKTGCPPWVVFHWGAITSFTAYVKSVSVKYTLFTPGGMPIRGTATVNLEEIAGEQQGQNPTSGALSARRVHTVVAGDSLPSIAWQEYGDPTVWRVVARANDVDDPLRLPAGTTLVLPAPEELSTVELTGPESG